MEMLIMASGGLNSIASSLGHLEGDTYVISEYCEDVLEEMLDNLKLENKVTRPVRINIANSKVLEGDLLHILSAAKDNFEAFQAIVRLLVNLSMPLEVISPVHPNMTKADWEQRRTLQVMLQRIKRHFVQEPSVKSILEQMSTELENHGPYRMDKASMESMNDCLMLIRNILHIEEKSGMTSDSEIVRHLLDNSFGEILHSLLSREEAEIWISALVQIVRLMFRDQMSQDLVKRATRLHSEGHLFASAQPGALSEDGTGAENTGVDAQSLWNALTESMRRPHATSDRSAFPLRRPGSIGPPDDGQTGGCLSSDSGFSVLEPCARGSAEEETGANAGRGESGTADGRRWETDSPPAGWDRTACSAEGFPRSPDASPSAAARSCETTAARECLCWTRDDPGGSPESRMSEEDDACCRSSGNGSTVSRSSENSSSSSSCSSETGSYFSRISSPTVEPCKQELLRNRLCKFAVTFCQTGLNRLIQLSQDNFLHRVSDCYILWCLSYFLPFSSLSCITYSDVRYNLSSMVVTYLMFVTLNTWVSFTLAAGNAAADSKSNVLFRRLYLLVASLRQILSSTRRFMEKELGAEEQESLSNFIKCLCQLEGLRKLYLLLLRKFRPKNESVQYLRALVVGNDDLLRIVTSERAYEIVGEGRLSGLELIKQLACPDVLLTYNELLGQFGSNSRDENEVVFTLLYHTAVDLQQPKLVYQLPILDTFADLWEHGPEDCISESSWDFMDHIVKVFALDCMNNPDALREYTAVPTGRKRKHDEIDDTSEDEYYPCMKSPTAEGDLSLPTMQCDNSSKDETFETKHARDSLEKCIAALTIRGYKPQIVALQNLLLETCYAKLACPKTTVVEPVVWLNHIQTKSVPLFAFSRADELALSDADFQAVLCRLGLHSARDSRHLYPSIPAFWTAEMCLDAARMLGDFSYDKLEFALTPECELRPEYLETQMTSDPSIPTEMGPEPDDEKPATSRVANPMALLPQNMWLSVVQQLNADKEAKA